MSAPGRLLYLNFRFIYRVSQWFRQRFSPAGLLILGGVIASGIFGIDTRQSLAFQVFAITLTLLILSVIATLFIKGDFRFHRRLPEYGTAGVPLRYKVIIDNLGAAPARDVLFRDQLANRFPEYEEFRRAKDPLDRRRNWLDRKIGYPRLMSLLRRNRGGSLPLQGVDVIPARDEREVEVEFTPLRRGYLQFTGSSIARPDPLGLFRAILPGRNREKLLILPRTYRVPRIKLAGHRRYQRGGINQASVVGDSQEFMSLRDYQPGDPLRSIHWRSYARRGEPVVKEYRDEYFVRQGLVLDTFLGDRPPGHFEEAVSLAASFALAVEDQDSLLDLLFVGAESYHFTTGRSFGKAANMLEILACVNPARDRVFGDLRRLVVRHAGELGGMVVVLLDWDRERQDLVGLLVSLEIIPLVFVIRAGEDGEALPAGPLDLAPDRLVPLPAGDVQGALDRINWANL